MKKALYVFLQCTWGILQTLAGFAVFLCNLNRPHERYHGAIVTEWASPSSISLGMFLFVYNSRARKYRPFQKQMPKPKTVGADRGLVVHEYGHSIQSLFLGPLYLIVIGIPSLIWANMPHYVKKRASGVPYSAFWTERGANRLGERVTREKSFGDMKI